MTIASDDATEEETFGIPMTEFDEGTTIRLNGQFVVPSQNHSVRIEWGDGTVSESTLGQVTVREIGFTATHRFVDDLPSGAPQGDFTIRVIATDTISGASGLATRMVTVKNVPAQFDGPISVTPSPVQEGQLATLNGSIIDPGDADQHSLTIQWGDGSAPELYVVPAGARTFAVPHAFRDENPGVITVTLTDDDSGSASATTTAIVTNADPSATIVGPSSGFEGSAAEFSALGSDPGTADVLTYSWKVFAGNQQVHADSGPTLSYTPPNQGSFTIRLTARDGDGGVFTTSKGFMH